MGSEVRFRLRRGCKVSRDVHMLVNKPKVTMNGEPNFESIGEELKDNFQIENNDHFHYSSPQVEYTVT
jgi:hypothetical protein